jgi:cell division septation protein DedD
MKTRHTLLLIAPGFAAILAVAIGTGYFMGQTSFRLSPPPPGLAMPSIPTPGMPAPPDSSSGPAGTEPSAPANQLGGSEAPPGQPQDSQTMPSPSTEPAGGAQRQPTPPSSRTPTSTTPGPTALPVIPAPPSRFHVQAGAFDDRDSAASLVKQLRDHGYAVTLVEGPPYRVWVGGYLDRATADRLAANLNQAGFEATLTPR